MSSSGTTNNSNSAEADAAALEIAVGPAARARSLARRELQQAGGSPRPQHLILRGHVASAASNAGDSSDVSESPSDTDASFALSPRHIDPQELEELQRRPPVAFAVVNSSSSSSSNQKEDAVMQASAAAVAAGDAGGLLSGTAARVRSRQSQSWHSPVHVPLSHRKLVATPSIFSGVVPFPPTMPQPPQPPQPSASRSAHKRPLKPTTHESPRGGGGSGGVPKLAKLAPERSNQVQSLREQLISGCVGHACCGAVDARTNCRAVCWRADASFLSPYVTWCSIE